MTDDILVLYVDDNAALRDLTADLLERVNPNLTVRTEADPSTVRYQLTEEAVNCIVSDYDMAPINGIELCRRVRRDHPDVPFFLWSNDNDPALIDEALEAGATDFLEKSTGIEHYKLLANRIENACERGIATSGPERMFDPSRDRGIFTRDDRMYLLGEKDYSHYNTETNTRRRVRNRVRDSIIDMSYLPFMRHDDIRQVFDELTQADIHDGISGLIAFSYVAYGGDIEPLEEMLESGIFTAGSLSADSPMLKNVEVDIEVSREPDINRIIEKHDEEAGMNLSNNELGLLLRSGRVELSELQQYVED